ncbi:pain [Trypoxylus dichotomus]
MSFCLTFSEFVNFLDIPLYNEKQIEYFCRLVDDTMENRRESKNRSNDLLQIILGLQNGNVINDIESKGFCMLFLLAGFEPTASALTFALFELAVNENVRIKLRDEITTSLATITTKTFKMSDQIVLLNHQHLQYPVGYADSEPIIIELEKGASLEKYTLENVNPKMLELHLDSCISAEINMLVKEKTEITFDYSTILPKSRNASEMKTVKTITEISRLEHLLVHPLISTVLKQNYFLKLSNWFEVLMLALCFCPIFLPSIGMHKQLCALGVLAVVLELAIVVKGHPGPSKYIVMLRTVTLTFFHFFLSYSLLLIAFGLSFYKLFYEKSWKDSSNIAAAANCTDSKDEPPGFINGIALTFFKMIVMLTGELNASSFKFETFIHGVLFVAFVLVVPIILLNLLCGLAVYDVGMIRENAEKISYKEVVKYLVFTEKYITAIADLRPQWNFLKQKIFFQRKELLNKRLTVCPYTCNEKTKLLGRRTIRRIERFLFLNEDKQIIQHLGTIKENRKKIRELIAAENNRKG